MPYLAEQKQADDVYEAVIADLEDVIGSAVLPMKWEDTATEYNVGKVSQAMAYMLYAEMVMYQNDESRYAKALGYMREIINCPDYGLLDSYADIFEESGEWGRESIFEVDYKDDNAMRSWDTPLVAGGTVLPRLISPSAWAPNPGDDSGVVNGWGFGPVRTEAYQMYAEGDTRRDVTCFDANAHGTYEHRYQDTGYFLGKYIGKSENNKDQSADDDLNFNNNLRVYRFAETLLNAAEPDRAHGRRHRRGKPLPQRGAPPRRTCRRRGPDDRQHRAGAPPRVRGRGQALLGLGAHGQGRVHACARQVRLPHQHLDRV